MASQATTRTRTAKRSRRRWSLGIAVDWFFFIFAGLAAIWLAYLGLTETFHLGWWAILSAILFWVLLAYLVLPRLHRILTTIYVPDYFIGRTRTSDGLLGDPVNLAFMGRAEQIQGAMRAAGWTEADPVTLGSSWRIVLSTITRRSYEEAPVSPLFLFSRQQDFAFQQEVDGSPGKRHHVRFWRCPDDWLLPGGRRVDWLAAGTFDTSVGLSLFTLQVTHRIDDDTDVERDHIVRTLLESDPTITVDVIADFSSGYHARNGGGDSIHTDGDLPIVDVGSTASSIPVAHVYEPAAHPETAPLKRPAFESAERLLQRPGFDPDMKRPSSVVAGASLVFLRAAAGLIVLADIALNWAEFATPDAMDTDDAATAELVLVVFAAFMAASVLLDTVLGVLIARGVNWARVTAMVFSTISISTSFVDWWNDSAEEITINTTLFSLGLDILLLLALSSRSAAAYARRNERR
ncbi:LssY C-terminal domain-containing protein [Microbacterium sp. BWT-B31]|uniref:LssY C-terminal domain-containing protein n=1 Tax=Microbacterium sp. BWT-B31 TaxID=3232072 RepID=UPI003526D3BA